MGSGGARRGAGGRAAAVSGAVAGDRPLAVEARGLVKRFGAHRGLDGVDLAVPAGAFLSIFRQIAAG